MTSSQPGQQSELEEFRRHEVILLPPLLPDPWSPGKPAVLVTVKSEASFGLEHTYNLITRTLCSSDF